MTSVAESLQTAMHHHRQGELDRAQAIYRDVIRIDPGHADALHLLGVTVHQQRDHQAAIDLIGRAICVDPRAAAYHCNLGVVFQALGKSEKAAKSYRQAIQLTPDYAEAHNNLGHALQSLGRLDDAIASYERALELCPDYADAQLNLGNVRRDLGQLDETMARYERAVSLNPNDAETRLSRALAMLLLGDLERGFREYEWRWPSDNSPYDRRSAPLWDGSELRDGTLFIFGEQGIGDEIMFASCLPDCIERVGRCVVECDPRLVPLLSRSFPMTNVVSRQADPPGVESSQPIGEISAQIAIGSLPRLFRGSPAAFPGEEMFLTANPAAVAMWRQRLADIGSDFKVGISWRGGKEESVRQQRSTTLKQWEPLFSVDGVQFVNLQYGECEQELSAAEHNCGIKIYRWPDVDPLIDLDQFAAQIAALDLVISVDNSTVHLAGALGVPTWVMVPMSPNWRWMLKRPDSPWYPSLNLYRQDELGEWAGVINRLAGDLKTRVEKGSADTPASQVARLPVSDVERERTKYEQMWTVDDYRIVSPGLENLEKLQLIDRLRSFDVRTILDAGCGSGKLLWKLLTDYRNEFVARGFDISENCLDPCFDEILESVLTVGCLWDDNDFCFAEPFDAVICTDVLEHIPTEYIPAVLRNLCRATRKVCYLAIALFPDGFGPKLLGEPLHLTVETPAWWFDQFTAAGLTVQAQGVEQNAAGQNMWLHAFLTP